MLYLGIDQHARQITISLRDDSGDVLQARQVSTRLEFTCLESLFLGHAPQSIADRHYAQVPQELLDDAVTWLGGEFGVELEA